MRSDRAAPHPEMVGAGIAVLSEGTNLLEDGTGLITAEDGEERKTAEHSGSRVREPQPAGFIPGG